MTDKKELPYEKDFQTAFLKKLRMIPKSWWMKCNDRVTVGLPDIFGFVGPYGGVLELKTRSKVTKIQAYTLGRIAKTGAFAFVVTPDNADEVYAYLLEMSQRLPFLGAEYAQKP
jgi:hypothetical protein